MENRIDELRKERGLSLKDVAEGIGVTVTHLANMKKGVHKQLSQRHIDRLAKFFGVEPWEIIGGSPRNEKQVYDIDESLVREITGKLKAALTSGGKEISHDAFTECIMDMYKKCKEFGEPPTTALASTIIEQRRA